MARKPNGRRSTIKDLTAQIQRNMDSLYRTTYYNEPTGNQEIDALAQKINSNISNIIKYNIDTAGVPSITKLYSRMHDKLPATGLSDIDTLFTAGVTGFDDFYANFMQNRYLRELDDEIDAVCKYFPDLLEALEIKKEGVLSADHFSKDFMTVIAPDGANEATFTERIKQIKKTYNLLELVDEAYDKASKYGEQFIYIIPYKIALSKLLTNKPNTNNGVWTPYTHEGAYINLNESVEETFRRDDREEYMLTFNEKSGLNIYGKNGSVKHKTTGKVLTESAKATAVKENRTIRNSDYSSILHAGESVALKVEFDRSGVIESFVKDTYTSVRNKAMMTESMSAAFERSILHESDENKLVIVKKNKSGKLSIDGMEDTMNSISNDGLVSNDPTATKPVEEVKVDVPGCVIAKPRRENIIPIMMGTNHTNLGYFYLEFTNTGNLDDAFQGFTNVMSDTLTTLRGSNNGVNAPFNNVEASRQEEVLRYIAGELSKFIDKEFVQTNQDLREEIYTILKYNDLFNNPSLDKMKITFVPPEDMIHVYFKLDKLTHRGISDLDRAMIPAKIYASMYITDAIGHMIRGQDKRVYFVKQQVENNIAKVLMNTIQQLKQGNFGIRQFQSINSVLNITGQFNDFVIPTSASGESPISIDVIPGQQFTDNSDMKQQLREMAINSTDVPFELIQTRQSVDYAMQLSMSNSKFLRKIFKRQTLFQPILSRLITKIYCYEFNESVDLEVQLPPPMFLTMANTGQLVDNTKNYIQSITEFEMADEEDEKLKATYTNLLFKYYLGSQIDLAKHEMILKKAKAEAGVKKEGEEQ